MKRIVSFFLTVVMVLPCLAFTPVMAATEEHSPEVLVLPEQKPAVDGASTADGLVYEITDGTITIYDYNGTDETTVIPGTVEGYPVKAIGESAFSYCRSIQSIVLPDGVTDIKKNAFYFCDSMERIELPATLVSIGEQAFINCYSLYSIELPATLTSIGKSAFLSCNCLAEVINHSSLAIQKGSEDYGAVAYYAEEVHRSSSKMVVEDGFAFYPTHAGYLLIVCLNEKEDPVFPTLDRPCCAIRSYAFYSLDSIKSIVIPEGVQSIGDCAFIECTALERVELPSSLLRVGDFVFYDLDSLKEGSYNGTKEQWDAITWGEWNNSLLDARLSFAAQCTHSYFNACDTDCNVCKAVREAPHCYFNACDTDCNLCGLVREITHGYDHACDPDCNECGEVRAVSHVYTDSCDKTCNVCGAVRSDAHSYDNPCDKSCNLCGGLRKPPHSFVNWTCEFCAMPQGLVYTAWDGTATITDYNGKASELVIPSVIEGYPVRAIQSSAFARCSTLVSVELPDGLTTIGENAFENCSQLAEIKIPDSVTAIGDWTFYNCQALRSFRVPESITSIGEYAFMYCINLQTVTLPDGLTDIGYAAFGYCYHLAEVITNTPSLYTVGSLDLGYVAFYAAEVHSGPSKLVQNGDYLFYPADGGYQLITYLGEDSIPVIPSMDQPCVGVHRYAFYKQTTLTSIVIPEGVTTIGREAFSECAGLTSITIPVSVTNIDYAAFYNCTALSDVYYGGTRARWEAMTVEIENACLLNATIHFLGEHTHSYDHACDPDCNECGEVRQITHRYVNGFCEVCGKEELPESLHPYPNDANEEYLLHREGAVAMAVTFSPDTFVETGWDHIYLYDKDGNRVLPYTTGTSLAGRRVVVMGDSLRIVLQSDSSGAYYGFSITKLEVCYGHGCLQPAETDCDVCGAVRQVSHHYENGVCKTCSWPEGLEYTVTEGEVSVTAYEGTAAELVIPSVVEGFPVVALINHAFNSCKTLVRVELPDSMTSIGYAMFSHCSALESIRLPVGLTLLEQALFYNCDSLVEVEIPAGVTEIGYDAFGSCEKLMRIWIPEGVTLVGDIAFEGCAALEEVYYFGTKDQWKQISMGRNNSYLTSARIHYHYGREHTFDGPWDADCNECYYVRELGSDGKILLRTDDSTVVVGRPFDVYVDLNALTEAVGSIDLHLLLSDNLQYVSHEILVKSSDFMLTAFDPASLYFGCGMTMAGVTGDYPLLKLTLVAVSEGEAELSVSLSEAGEGVGNLMGDAALDFVGSFLSLNAIVHVCDFSCEIVAERYLKSSATCTEAAVYYKSCECGEKGEETFAVGEALGHSLGQWLSDSERHWHHCSVCGEDLDVGEHDYTDFWDKDCEVCLALRSRPLMGDVNGDGEVNFSDIQRIYAHRVLGEALTGDALIIADVNLDGAVNFFDIQRIYQHLSTDHKLF